MIRSQVRALTRAAKPETESDLLELAKGVTAARLERVVRAWKRGSRGEEAARERARHRERSLSVFPDEDGMYVVRGLVDPEVGAALMRALEAATDALYRKERREARRGEWACEGDRKPEEREGSARGRGTDAEDAATPGCAEALRADTRRAAARRRADAIGLLAERALAAGFGTAREREEAAREREEATGEREEVAGEPGALATAPASPAPAPAVPVSGSRAERYQVFLHVEPATLAAEGEPGRAELEDGTRVAAETARRIACDAARVTVAHDPEDGQILDLGRRTRTIPPALRRALELRDRGCRFPGCGLRFTDAHHIRHWADGGETSLANTLLLCRYHHRLVHEEGWRVESWGKGRVAFYDPRGQAHIDGGWEPPELTAEPVEALIDEHRRRGIRPDPYTASARWKRERDIPDHVLFGALEACL